MVCACGNAGDSSMLRIAANLGMIDAAGGGGFVTNITIGGIVYLRVSLPAGTSAQPATLTATSGANVSNSSLAHNGYSPFTLDVPCIVLNGSLSPFTLSFTNNGTVDTFMIDFVGISACVVETCGGQNITCPAGLLPTKPCTPGVT